MRRTPVIVAMLGALALAGCAPGDGDEPGQMVPTTTAEENRTKAPSSPTPSPTTPATPAPTATPTEGRTNGTDDGTGDGTDEGTGDGTEEAGGSDVAAMAFASCETDDYTVGYPEDWNTNDPDGAVDACRVFHPGEIDVEPAQDMDLHYAVSMYVDAVAYEDVRDADPRAEVLDERELTVAGRDAFVREVRSTGEGLTPEGERRYAYTVDLDGEILVGVTHSVGDTDYERDKAVLDRMLTEELALAG